MKFYKKKYEDYFNNVIKVRNDPNRNSPYGYIERQGNDLGLPMNDFNKKLRREYLLFEKLLWEQLIKIEWLKNKFTYKKADGMMVVNNFTPGSNRGYTPYGTAKKIFLYREINVDNMLLLGSGLMKRIVKYFNIFYPNFDKNDPYTEPEKYKYPFKHITIEYLYFVYFVDPEDREGLLEYGDKKKMTYLDFCDYVLNHCLCINDELGREKYALRLRRMYSWWSIVNMDLFNVKGKGKNVNKLHETDFAKIVNDNANKARAKGLL